MAGLQEADPTSSIDGQIHDPFVSPGPAHQRFSNFNSQLFALNSDISPDRAKSALEAHLAETERRIHDASRLGTTLVKQRQELTDKLEEVEKQQGETDITPELRAKLAEIEKEFNDVGRETARTFMPRSRVTSMELGPGSPHAEALRNVSPSKFESQATSSPSKLSVPNRRHRNQPSNRVHDIEFATEISTSLLQQVRNLQALLAEKEEALRDVEREKARLEREAEGFHERLRSLDESENRYKDENWSLETQIHEYIASSKQAADREKRLTQSLNLVQAEKGAAQKELDDIKLSHAKFVEDHSKTVKQHDAELGSVKRNMVMVENERGAMQRKIDELTAQNQELVKAVAYQHTQLKEQAQGRVFSEEEIKIAVDHGTPDGSPPASPIKGTPRHSMLESETLKSSLQHAHRMIQNLKGNIHREKTEKLELKRLLQDARDEVDVRRAELALTNSAKKTRRLDAKDKFKKPPPKLSQLGNVRKSESEVAVIDELNWEDEGSPSRTSPRGATGVSGAAGNNYSTDNFETANEASDAFETANEQATETEDFQTGAEEMTDENEMTETENNANRLNRKSSPLSLRSQKRSSVDSTASISSNEYRYQTPSNHSSNQRIRSRASRISNRRTRLGSEDRDSPTSYVNNSSRNGTPHLGGQSLFAELENQGLDDSEQDDNFYGSPSQSISTRGSGTPNSRPGTGRTMSRPSTARIISRPFPLEFPPPLPKPDMVDSGMMTDDWQPISEPAVVGLDEDAFSDATARRPGSSDFGDRCPQHDLSMEDKLGRSPSPPSSLAQNSEASVAAATSTPLTLSTILVEDVKPITPVFTPLEMSKIRTEQLEPVSPLSTPLRLSNIHIEHLEPSAIPATPLGMSSIISEGWEPVSPVAAVLAMSAIRTEHSEPLSPKTAPLVLSSVQSQFSEPVIDEAQDKALLAELALVENRKTTSLAELAPLEDRKNALLAELAPLADRKSALVAELTPLEDRKSALSVELAFLENRRTALLAESAPLEDQKTALLAELAPLEDQKAALLAELASLENRKTALLAELAPLEDRKTALLAESAPLEDQKTSLLAELAALQDQKSALLAELAPLNDRKSALADHLALLDSEIADKKKDIEGQTSALLAELALVESQIADRKRDFEGQKSAVLAELALVESEIADKKKGIEGQKSALLTELARVESEIAGKKRDFEGHKDTLLAELALLEGEIEDKRREIEGQKSALLAGLALLEDKIEDKKRSLEDAPVQSPLNLGMSTILSENSEPMTEERTFSAAPTRAAPPPPVAEPFSFSPIKAIDTEPVEPRVRSATGAGMVVPVRSDSLSHPPARPETPKAGFMGSVFSRGKNKNPVRPIIAEDSTRQLPSHSQESETPDSQKPFKDISSNTDVRANKKPRIETFDESSQTALTASQIDEMLKASRRRESQGNVAGVGQRRSKVFDTEYVHESTQSNNRPTSSTSAASNRASISSSHPPPLPSDHRRVIAAAAQSTGSSSGGAGTMGPPPLSASALRAKEANRLWTPIPQQNYGTALVRDGTTPRASRAEVSTPSGFRSRASSLSSFASECDVRFNMKNNGLPMPHGCDSSTDPRMIQAITQTMIGEYLWKYTRKAGRGDHMSENRHRRYFWVHPYTRTLYWSDKDPSTAGRAQLKAKSLAIEAVRVVTDDNIMPPGLHRKSIVIITPGRSVKLTAPTGQRHETWFNALSYLLLRTSAHDQDSHDTAAAVEEALTQQEVDEFNPQRSVRSVHRAPPSSSSYASTHQTETSPIGASVRKALNPPSLHQSPSRPSPRGTQSNGPGTLSRLSNYWKPGDAGTTGSGRMSRASASASGSVYAASYRDSEAHDSAEDLRLMIERQDREADRLENVRACCDGKHDVGSLHRNSRHSSAHVHTLRSGRQTPAPGEIPPVVAE